MTRGSGCGRLWQVEAAEDGRLSGPERASFERHAASCPTCSAEQRSLGRLRDLALHLPEDRPGELERRRLRLEILRRADAIVTGAENPGARPRYRLAVAAGLALALCGGSWLVLDHGFSPDDGAAPASASTPRLRPAFTLARGSGSACGAAPVPGGTRDVPRAFGDREVAARSVTAGGRAEVENDTLSSPVRGARDPSAVAWTGLKAHRSTAKGVPNRRAEGSPLKPRAQSGNHPRVSTETPGTAFSAAIAAFTQERYALAEERFREFERRYPEDTRVEDAAFLRAVCRQRRGDRDGAAREAGEYLRRYPAGFRHREAGAMLVGY